MSKTMCHICGKHPADCKDYRFIESVGLQGKVFDCTLCFGLNDVAIVEIIRDGVDPEDFYQED